MLQERYENDKFFEYIAEQIVTMGPVLAQIDVLLDDEELYYENKSGTRGDSIT